jgi:hypothetical protein
MQGINLCLQLYGPHRYPAQCDVAADHSDILSDWNKQKKTVHNFQEIRFNALISDRSAIGCSERESNG